MGLLDFLSSVPIVGSVMSAFDAGLDSIGASQHGRDQYVSQENQRELLAIQNQYNQENFDRQFAAENAEFDRRYQQYQSPQALVRQYSEAGLNPSAVLAGGKAGFGGVGSAVNPTSPSVPSVSPSSPMGVSGKSSPDYIDALSRMNLNEAQTSEIYSLLLGKLREQDDTHKWQGVLTAQKMFEYELDKKYGDDKRANEIANMVQDGLLKYMQGQEAAANALFLKAKEMLAYDEHKFNQVKYPKYGLYLDAMIQGARAQAAKDLASAFESRQHGALYVSEKDAQDIANNLSKDTYDSRLKEMLSDYQSKDKANEANYQKAIDMLNKYETLNANNDNNAAKYLNYTLWFIKEHCPSLPIVPLLRLK